MKELKSRSFSFIDKSDFFWGKYEILDELGRGGMGKVYKAYDAELKRTVAIKTLLAQERANTRQKERFRQEAQILARLSHPNIIRVFEAGEHKGTLFFVMEYLEGETLERKMKEKILPVEDSLRIMETIAKAVAYLHGRNILHRDLKPANVMITRENEIKIMDFGLSKIGDSGQKLSQEGEILGTVPYMPSEQLEGGTEEVDERSDVYSLGIILYQMLTRVLPFTGETVMNIVVKKMSNDPPTPSFHNPSVSLDLDTLCLKAMERKKEDRYRSVEEFRQEISRYLAGEPILARPVGSVEKGWRKIKRNPLVATLTALLGILSLSFLFFLVRSYPEPVHPKPSEKAPASDSVDMLLEEIAAGSMRVRSLEKNADATIAALIERLETLSREKGAARKHADILAMRKKLIGLFEEYRNEQIASIDDSLRQGLSRKEYEESAAHLTALSKPRQGFFAAPSTDVAARILFVRAQLYERIGEEVASSVSGTKASLEMAPEKAVPWFEKAKEDYLSFLKTTRNVKAKASWHVPFAKSRGGICLYRLGEIDRARRIIEKTMDEEFDDVPYKVAREMAISLLEITFRQGDFEGLQKRFEQVEVFWNRRKNLSRTEFRPVAELLYQKALVLLGRRDYARARFWFQRYLKEWFPSDWRYFVAICDFYDTSRTQDREKLFDVFEAIRQTYRPYHERASLFLAYLYWKKGNLEQARVRREAAMGGGHSHHTHPEWAALLDDPGFRAFMGQ